MVKKYLDITPTSGEEFFSKGMSHFINKNYKIAFQHFKTGFEKYGELYCLYRYSRCYFDGLGVTKDTPKALKLLQIGDDAGEPLCTGTLGYHYDSIDSTKAENYYLKGKEFGNLTATRNLLFLHEYSNDKSKLVLAYGCAEILADKGDREGCESLISMLKNGKICRIDLDRAKYYEEKLKSL